MGQLLKAAIWIKGGRIKRSLDRATTDPQAAQLALLRNFLQQNQTTQYGEMHQFSRITTWEEYADAVPINTFQDLVPFVDRMKTGERNVLTADQPVLFNMTSGTTAEPKYVPLTRHDLSLIANRSHQWLYRALADHPKMLDAAFVCIVGAATEGHTASGIPYGSASGMMYESLPRALRRAFAIPFMLSGIKDYRLRYYAIARLALEKEVSFVVTPNPTTLLKMAETGIRHQEEIVRAIRDGMLFDSFKTTPHDRAIVDRIAAPLRPNRKRARELENVIGQHGSLLPYACWKKLKLIGCWLGGSIGYQADRLDPYFGETPKRDLGYVASEGCMTVPHQDNNPAGILALHNNFYEFIPYDQNAAKPSRPLLCHGLEVGKQYRIILTNHSGLYRYDIDDIVEVRGFTNRTPMIAFVQKGADILNITGEKLHANHVMEAFRHLAASSGLTVSHYRFIPNPDKLRYEILIRLESDVARDILQASVLPQLDDTLSALNIEYAGKRKSGRLNLPCLHLMDDTWVADVSRNAGPSPRTDVQYKWRVMAATMSDIDARHIQSTINP